MGKLAVIGCLGRKSQRPVRRKLQSRVDSAAGRQLQRPVRIIPRPTVDIVAAKAQKYGVRLFPWEIEKIAQQLDEISDGDWRERERKLQRHLWKTWDAEAERQMLLDSSWKIYEGTFALWMLRALEVSTVGLFAIVATQTAGQAGMHVLGATFVGVVGSLGGATFNNVLVGDLRGGVFFIRDLRWLALATGTSVTTFYAWPEYESWAAECELRAMQRAAHVPADTPVTMEQFVKALEEDPKLAQRIRSAVSKSMGCRADDLADGEGVSNMFHWLAGAEAGVLEASDLQNLARLQVMQSPVVYGLESILTGTAGIDGALSGLNQGKHPLACICLGVSICFGSVARDLICGRDVSMGTSSFALACGISASTYVGLRELVFRGVPIPLFLRILFSVGAAACQRAYCWMYLEPGEHALEPMRTYRAVAV